MKKIKVMFYPKQCDLYYKYLKEGDMVAAHLLHLPPVYRTLESIQSEVRMKELEDTLNYELKRIEETPNELLELELKLRLNDPKTFERTAIKVKRPSLFSIFPFTILNF